VSALLIDKDGAVLAMHGVTDPDLARRYAATKASGDRDVMELTMLDLFPEDEVDGVMFASIGEGQLPPGGPGGRSRLEVALPIGFDRDPHQTSVRLERTADELRGVLANG
jgi:hypothetical protein